MVERVWGRTRDALTQEQVQERLQKLEHAAKLKIIDQPQADVTKVNADAAAQMIKALESVRVACVQIGSLLIVKYTPKKGHEEIFIKTLTAQELMIIEKDRSLLKSPEDLVKLLDKEPALLMPPENFPTK